MGEDRHARFTVNAGGARARAVAFGVPGGRLPVATEEPVDATFALSRRTWNGAVEPQLQLRSARASAPAALDLVGEPADFVAAALAELDAPLEPWPSALSDPARTLHDRRDRGIAGCLGALVASGEPVLVVCADVRRRARALAGRFGGFALCSYAALEHRPEIADPYPHVFALDPPAHAHHERLLASGPPGTHAHLGYGQPELRFARSVHEHEYGQRELLATLYRALRDRGGAAGGELEALLRGDAERPRSAAAAGRGLRVLAELGLVTVDLAGRSVAVTAAGRTSLERSPAFRAYERRYEDGARWLSGAAARAA
jgi:single-stranded-DNA-specific exonuclease